MILAPSRAAATASMVKLLATRRAPRRRIPLQIFPRLIEREYERHLVGFADRLIAPFSELENELPRMLANVASEARIDSAITVSGSRYDAGESRRVRQLMEEARKKMNAALTNPEIERLAEEFARRTSAAQRIQINRQTRAALGVDVLASDRRVGPLMEAFVDANVGLIRKLSDETAGRIESAVMRAVQDAQPWDEFKEDLKKQFGFPEVRARVIARDQIGKFYGQVNAARQRELGVEAFIWRASNDERVRDEHEAIDGNRYLYSDGGHPTEGLPGEPVQCRCQAEPDFSTIKELIDER